MAEVWLPAVGLPGYQVSNLGNVIGPRGKVLNPMTTDSGHRYFIARRKKRYVHAVVLGAFIGPCPPGQECLHGDDNPSNNRVDNLRWGTRLENMQQRKANGGYTSGVDHHSAKISPEIAEEIRVAAGSSRAVAVKYGVSHTTVLEVRRNHRWTKEEVSVG